MKKMVYLWFCFLLIFSCSSVPSVHKIQQSFENTEPNIKNGLIKIISFQKTNAQKGVKEGIKFYRVEYEAQIEFLKKVWEIDPEKYNKVAVEVGHSELIDYRFLHLIPDSLDPGMQNPYSIGYLGMPHDKGETKNISGMIVFEMTEKGWQITNISVLSK